MEKKEKSMEQGMKRSQKSEVRRKNMGENISQKEYMERKVRSMGKLMGHQLMVKWFMEEQREGGMGKAKKSMVWKQKAMEKGMGKLMSRKFMGKSMEEGNMGEAMVRATEAGMESITGRN